MKAVPRLRILGLVLGLVAAQGLIVLAIRWVEREREANGVTFPSESVPRKPAPVLELLKPDGSHRTLMDLRGKPVLLHFWATWCPPCKEELPALLELGRELEREGELEVVALAMDPDWTAVREFFDGEIPPEVVRDSTGSAAASYDVSTLPDSYLLGADGSTRLRFSEARDWQTELARDTLRRSAKDARKH